MVVNSKYDFDVVQLNPYPKISPTWWNNLRQLTHDIVGNNDGGLYSVIEITSFTYSTGSNLATVSGWAFVNGQLVTYDGETVSADDGEYIFATGTQASPTLTASANIYSVEGALIGLVSDTDTATAMYNRKDLDGGYFKHIFNECFEFNSPKTFFTAAHEIEAAATYALDATGEISLETDSTFGVVATGATLFTLSSTYGVDAVGAITIDSDSTVTIGGTVINITSDAGTTDINLGGNVDITETLDLTGNFNINTDKFNVTAASGNTTIAGTLGITGVTSFTGSIGTNIIPNSNGRDLGTETGPYRWTLYSDAVYINGISLGATGSGASTSGAYKIGTYDEFNHSDSTNVQDVLDDLDAAIYNLNTTLGLGSLTLAEVQQLQNIGSSAISAAEWGYVASMQSVSTSATPTFVGISFSTRTYVRYISACEFVGTYDKAIDYDEYKLTFQYNNTGDLAYAAVHLPQGAVVTAVNPIGNSGTCTMYRIEWDNSISTMASCAFGAIDSSINNATIDNDDYRYILKADPLAAGSILYYVKITYTMTSMQW